MELKGEKWETERAALRNIQRKAEKGAKDGRKYSMYFIFCPILLVGGKYEQGV